MALTLTEKQTLITERTNDPQGLGLIGGSAAILQKQLNAEGTASIASLVIPDRAMDVSKADIYRRLSNASIAAWRAWIDSGADENAVAAKEIWDTFETIDMSESRVQELILAQGTAGYNNWSDTEAQTVANLGKVGQSRSQELIGRNITLDEAQEVING